MQLLAPPLAFAGHSFQQAQGPIHVGFEFIQRALALLRGRHGNVRPVSTHGLVHITPVPTQWKLVQGTQEFRGKAVLFVVSHGTLNS